MARPRELAFLGIWAIVFLAVNLGTAELYPVVWLDEVMYADPAVNLYLGNGFRSTAWPAQSADGTWMSNSPLYQGLLYLWMRIFGFSLVAVRSMNYVLAASAILLVWLAALRSGLLSRERSRVLLVLLLTCGFGFSFIYRSGRPDVVAMLPVVLALAAGTLRRPGWRLSAVFACGLCVPVAGLPSVPYLAILGALLLLFLGLRVLPVLVSMAAGVAAGGGIFLAVLEKAGLESTFLGAVMSHSSVSGEGGLGALGAGVFRRLGENPHAAYLDWSANFLALAAVTVVGTAVAQRRLKPRSPMVFALVAAVWIPTCVAAAGKYPLYYSWMAWVPVVLAFLRHREEGGDGPLVARLCRAAVVLALAVGLPLQLAIAIYDREARDYSQVERLVAEVVEEGSRVYCHYAVYYPVKQRAAAIFFPTYNRHFKPGEPETVDKVILRIPRPAVWWEALHPRLEELWRPTDRGVESQREGLRFLTPHTPYVDYTSLRVYESR